MNRTCDLHTHSTFSDGTVTPRKLVALAEAAGLSAIALCDHNTVAGLPEFLAAGEGSGVEVVPGVEFSTDWHGTELHILGLFIGPEHYGAIRSRMDALLAEKDRCNRNLVEALNRVGIPMDYDKMKEETPAGNLNRAVIGAEIARLGCADSVKDAFDRYLSVKRGYYQPPKRPEALEIIRFIKSTGAVAVLAHPFLNLKREEDLRAFLTEAVEAGLDGMEVRYPLFDVETTCLAARIAEEFGLLPSGGSDFHGANKPDISLGTGKGSLHVPLSWLDALRARRI